MSLVQYARIAARRWLAITLGVLLGVSGGLLWYATATKQYEGFAVVSINPITNELFSSTPVNQLVNTSTETAIMRSGAVAERAADLAGLDGDIRELLDDLSVSVPLNSLVMEVSFRAGSPEQAAAGANAFARGYLEHRGQSAEDRRQARIAGLSQQLDDLRVELSAEGEDAAERELLEDQIRSVRQQLTDTRALDVTPGQVITVAQPPRFASSPRLLIAGVGGVVLGILLGIGFAALAHRADDRLLSIGDAERLLGDSIAGVLPPFAGSDRLSAEQLDDVALAARDLTVGAFYRQVHTLLFLRPDIGERTAADVVAWWLGLGDGAVLLRLKGFAHAPPPAWSSGTFQLSPAVRLVRQPLPFQPSTVDAGEALLLVDTEGIHQLSDALASLDEAHRVVLCIELGRTRERDVRRVLHAVVHMRHDSVDTVAVVVRRGRWSQRLRHKVRRGKPTRPAAGQGRLSGPVDGDQVPTGAPSSFGL